MRADIRVHGGVNRLACAQAAQIGHRLRAGDHTSVTTGAVSQRDAPQLATALARESDRESGLIVGATPRYRIDGPAIG